MNRRSFFLRALATGAAMVPIKIKTIHAAEPSAPAAPPAIEDREERLLEETIRALYKMDENAIRGAVRKFYPGAGKLWPGTPEEKLYRELSMKIQAIRWPGGLFNVSSLNRGCIDYDAVIKPFHDVLTAQRLGRRYLGFSAQQSQNIVASREGCFDSDLSVSWLFSDSDVSEASEYRQDGGRAEFVFLGHEYSPDRFVGLAAP